MAVNLNNYAKHYNHEFDKWTDITAYIYMVYVWVRGLMSVDEKPTIDMYWDPDRGCKYIQALMSKDLFKRITKATAMYNVEDDHSQETNTNYKSTEMWERFTKAAQKFYHMSKDLAYDETMVKNYCRSGDNKKKKINQLDMDLSCINVQINMDIRFICYGYALKQKRSLNKSKNKSKQKVVNQY